MKTHGAGFVNCECLPIQLEERVGINHELKPVILPGVAGRPSRERVDFVLVGYFTGRQINLHDYYRELNLPADWATKDEDSPAPDDLFPEFCLEAWCHSRSPATQGEALLRELGDTDQKELSERGVPRCKVR